jgi:hypothetical protein
MKIDLPGKLVGLNPDEAFMPKAPIPVVPGVIGQLLEPHEFNCVPRPLDQLTGSWNIKVTIKDADTKDLQVRKDVTMVEILALTFQGVKFAPDERVKVLTKPAKMQDGALFRVEKVSMVDRLALDAKIWDGSVRKCGVEVSPSASVAEIVSEVQKRLNDEPLEDLKRYGMYYRNQESKGPWTRSNYELKPTMEVSGTVVVKCRTCDMTVPVPIFQQNRWQQLVYDALPDPPLTGTKTGLREFRAVYGDEVRPFKVRFLLEGEGEEDEINLLPLWENQKLKVQEAFGRETILDETRPQKDGVLYVKSADGSPPDPLCERVLTYTLGDDRTEFKVRVHKGDTVGDIREGLKRLHQVWPSEAT